MSCDSFQDWGYNQQLSPDIRIIRNLNISAHFGTKIPDTPNPSARKLNLIREGNFLGFEFLTRNEEINGHSHKERGIFKESFSPIFTYIFYYICYQKGAQLFLENLHIFGTKFLTPNTIFIAFLSINIF